MHKRCICCTKAALLDDSLTAIGAAETVVLKAEADALFNKIDSDHDDAIDEAELQATAAWHTMTSSLCLSMKMH